jgi:hypothetical protein
MTTTSKFASALTLSLMLCSCGADPVESNFLVVGSRAPSWYSVKYNEPFEQVQLEYSIHTSGNVDIDIRWRWPKSSEIDVVSGRVEERLADPKKSQLQYPRYMRIGVGATSDFYELKEPGPYLYVSDAPNFQNKRDQ